MSMVRTAVKAFAVLLLAVTAGVAGTGVAVADDPDTPREVRREIEALPWPDLPRGTTHWRVFVVKKLLLVPTAQNPNVYDAALHRAVTAYQQRKDLAERNRVGTETWENLRTDFGEVRQGASGPRVFAVQIGLVNNGFSEVDVDGLYGPETEGGVRRFQQRVGIGVDGIAGRLTFRALICMGA